MPRLTEEQKAANARQRIIDRLNCVGPVKAKNSVATEFQMMIRLEYAAKHGGMLHCCTCDRGGLVGMNFHAGHFIPGRRASVIFCEDPPNCHPQCANCNKDHHGRPDRYEAFMVDKYGADAVERLRAIGREDKQFTREQLADLLIGFRVRIKIAKERLS